jgi:carbon monoxide dehydrogenase subunit G
MNVKRQINVNAPAGQLWSILVEDYDRVGEWATAVKESTPNPDVPEGEGRICATTLGNNKETITRFDEQERSFTYAVDFERSPFFLEGIDNTWTVEPKGDNQSLVSMSANIELKSIIGQLIRPLLKRRMEKGFDSLLEELKYYTETGQVHPRKQEQLNSRKVQLAHG